MPLEFWIRKIRSNKACLPVSCSSKMRWRRDVTIRSFCPEQNKERHNNLTLSQLPTMFTEPWLPSAES